MGEIQTIQAWFAAPVVTNGDAVVIALCSYLVMHMLFGRSSSECEAVARREVERLRQAGGGQ